MVVLDTHAWLWWVAEPSRLSSLATDAIGEADQIGIATISCWEVAMLVEKRRIELQTDPARWVRQALARERVREIPLSARAAVEAALLPSDQLGGDPADRIIYATARVEGARLVTKDSRVRDFDPRLTIW